MYSFDVKRARSLPEAIAFLKKEGNQILAGGQTLIPTLKQRLASPDCLISIISIENLKGVRKNKKNELVIGGTTTHSIVNRDALSYTALSGLAGKIGDPAVRHRGTIGGSLANNDPSACYPAAALGSGATIVTSDREIPADDFFQGMFSTALSDGEIITEIRFPIPICASYQKFEQPASRFALVGVFLAKFNYGVRVAVTGASENGVFRWKDAEEKLSDAFKIQKFDEISLAFDDFISDMHGSAEFRANLVRVLTKRAVMECIK